MSYHLVYLSWDGPSVVGYLFLFLFIQYVHQQLQALDCQHFVHYISQLFSPFSGYLMGTGFHFRRGPTIFKIVQDDNFVKVCAH
jgi:hypothetical protein